MLNCQTIHADPWTTIDNGLAKPIFALPLFLLLMRALGYEDYPEPGLP